MSLRLTTFMHDVQRTDPGTGNIGRVLPLVYHRTPLQKKMKTPQTRNLQARCRRDTPLGRSHRTYDLCPSTLCFQHSPRKPTRQRTTAEQWIMEDALACVRRSLNHHDPYEEWEKETRLEASVCFTPCFKCSPLIIPSPASGETEARA